MNILTFDIEEWFHILDNDSTKTENEWDKYDYRLDANMDRIFQILEENNQQATFFCLGWVARHFPHIIKQIVNKGYEIATHSDRHQLAFEHSPADFKADLDRSIKSLEDASGKKIRAYRAPGFSLMEENKWVFEELISAGIEVDCSIFPAARSHGGFSAFGEETPTMVHTASGSIKEFPINTTSILGQRIIFSGGGYFRLIPWWMLKHFMKKSNYVMTYFHPRDFDPDQPVIADLSKLRKFKSYNGLRHAEKKLQKLITDYNFIDLSEAAELVDWNNTPRVKL